MDPSLNLYMLYSSIQDFGELHGYCQRDATNLTADPWALRITQGMEQNHRKSWNLLPVGGQK